MFCGIFSFIGALMTPSRLNGRTLPDARARLPAFDRTRLTPGIVHIGLGAFYRAHGVIYNDDTIETDVSGHTGWGIIGASLRSPDQRERLVPQDCLYTAIERSAEGEKARIAGSLLGSVVAPENPRALVAQLADPSIRIVTITVTEKGYCHDPATGVLNKAHPDIIADLQNPDVPSTLPGFLTAALAKRRAAGIAPFAVISCDNLPSNGKLLAGVVRDFAALRDDALAGWIERSVAFPCSMVDRIVPAVTPEEQQAALALTGLEDHAPVVHEPFRQWVIEDVIDKSARPAWERAGAQFVSEVEPFEFMKLRMLNGTHSALAYLGYLAGFRTVAETVSGPEFRGFLHGLWRNELIPTITPPPGVDLADYADRLLERYANPATRHRNWQIAMDGSQKLPQRILGAVRQQLTSGGEWDRMALVIAAFIRYAGGTDEQGADIDVRDPLAAALRDPEAGKGDPAARVRAVLANRSIFGTDLADDPQFCGGVERAMRLLISEGALSAIRHYSHRS